MPVAGTLAPALRVYPVGEAYEELWVRAVACGCLNPVLCANAQVTVLPTRVRFIISASALANIEAVPHPSGCASTARLCVCAWLLVYHISSGLVHQGPRNSGL